MSSMIARPAGRASRWGIVLLVALLPAVLLGACNSSNGGSKTVQGATASSSTGTDDDSEYSGACPTGGNSRAFAKTRFAVHAGLALGAFHRYIYKPAKNGGFRSGAPKRKRTYAKAAVAGVFTVHELKVAKKFALANPSLCNVVQSISDKFNTLTGKLKNGTATDADINSEENLFTAFQQTAGQAGFGFTEKNVTVPGAG
ncbi:hypothetical protein Manayef4_16115 [Frankia sp. CgMI4]|nr:hypothetical protein Manayef4_16115 [Frankia sp. CgIM4]